MERMNISVDGGALCASNNKQFGTYHFTKSMIRALAQYDAANKYEIYTFCSQPDNCISLNSNVVFKILRPTAGWMNLRVSLQEVAQKKDIFFALNQAIPRFSRSRIFAWSHGLAYLHKPNLYPDSLSRLMGQLLTLTRRAERIFVTSLRVKHDIEQFSNSTPIHVVPIGVPYDMPRANQINRKPFFLFVGMNHPIKNIQFIIESFNKLSQNKKFAQYRLLLATDTIVGLQINNPNVHHVKASRQELRHLYRTATALVSASLYESFNMPILEALSQGCPVVAFESAVIPEFLPYVNVAKTQEQFIVYLQEAATESLPLVPTSQIRSQFAWKPIIKTIVSYY